MKSQFVRIVLAAGLTVLGSLTLSAQDTQENAKVPFAFQASHTSFAAGNYSVYLLNRGGLFQVTSNSGGHSIFINTAPVGEVKGYSEPHLTFACYQGDCALSQIWMPGSKVGYGRSTASVDRDLQRKLGMATMISVRLTAH